MSAIWEHFDVLSKWGLRTFSCLAPRRKELPVEGAERRRTSFEVATDFLGCRPNRLALECMTIAGTSQILYGGCSEAMNVVIPRINLEVGGDVATFAHLQCTASILSAGGGILFGRFADRYGPKGALLVAHFAALTSNGIFATAQSKQMFYFACLPLLAKHGFQAAQQVATLHSTRETRPVALSRVGAAYGVGFLLGAISITEVARHLQPREIAMITVAVDASVLLAVLFRYPSRKDELLYVDSDIQSKGPARSSSVGKLLSQSHVFPLLFFKACSTASAGTVLSMMQQFAVDPFGMSVASAGLMTTYVGVCYVIAQAVVAPAVSCKHPRTLLYGTALSVGACLLSLMSLPTVASSGLGYAVLLGPLIIASHSSNVALTSKLTVLVPQSDQGQVLGMSMAAISIGYVFAPLAAASVFQTYGFFAVPFAGICGLIFAIVAVTLFDPAICDDNGEDTCAT